jgi:hypothetical protein
LIECGISLRGAEKVFEVFNHDELQVVPSFTGIRKWLGRIGIYELKRENEYRDDWIFIVDFTVELGHKKALVILGVSQKYFQAEVLDYSRCLSHKDVEVLGIEIMDSSKGEMIEKQLDKISERVGVPVQIVADNGSDLAKGIKLYQQKHPEVIYTHDVTHAMALILKKQLNSDERYQSFVKECNICRQKLQQTELSFIAPPAQRSQCRYFNVERLTEWASNLLNSSTELLMTLMPDLDESLIIEKMIEKLEWLTEYELDIIRWNQMLLLTRSIETHLKQSGISNQSPSDLSEHRVIFSDNSLQDFHQHVFDYVTIQSDKFKRTDNFLASSDVIESLFGKYKHFSSRCPLKEMGQMILTIYLSTMDLTTDLIKDALETISFVAVEDWLTEVFGRSTLSKRKILFSSGSYDTKPA